MNSSERSSPATSVRRRRHAHRLAARIRDSMPLIWPMTTLVLNGMLARMTIAAVV